MHLEVNGQTWRFEQSSRNEFDDIPMLVQELSNLGFKPYSLGKAVSYLKVTELQTMIRDCSDEDTREQAHALLAEHRVKSGWSWSLVNLSAPWRSRSKTVRKEKEAA